MQNAIKCTTEITEEKEFFRFMTVLHSIVLITCRLVSKYLFRNSCSRLITFDFTFFFFFLICSERLEIFGALKNIGPHVHLLRYCLGFIPMRDYFHLSKYHKIFYRPHFEENWCTSLIRIYLIALKIFQKYRSKSRSGTALHTKDTAHGIIGEYSIIKICDEPSIKVIKQFTI